MLGIESQSAYQTLSHYSHKLSDESDEERLDIFYNRPDSFSVNDGQLNFKSKINYNYKLIKENLIQKIF